MGLNLYEYYKRKWKVETDIHEYKLFQEQWYDLLKTAKPMGGVEMEILLDCLSKTSPTEPTIKNRL